MSATFEIKVTGVLTGTAGELTNVIKKADWVLKGTEAGQSFELPQSTDMGEVDAGTFVAFADVPEATVIGWIEAAETRMPSIKAHIQFVLDQMVSKAALTNSPMPWAPPVETPAPIEG